MSKHEKIYLSFFQDILAIRDQPFPILSKELIVRMTGDGSTSSAGIICQANADGWGQYTKQPSTKRIPEYLFQQLIPMIAGPQAIAVTNMKLTPVEYVITGAVKNGDIQLAFKIAAHPHVVIPDEKMDWNSAVSDFRQFPEDANKSLGDNGAVFEPEIKQVSEYEYHGSILACNVQETDNFALPLQTGCTVWGSEVKVGKEIYFFTSRDVHGLGIKCLDESFIRSLGSTVFYQ
jgi:hypothetical protein